ncbi:hypothetical protein SAMN04490189_4455 [Pseudomonas koreensis]|nr:hypothetical protein SAMN04490189_4455 [Pseudomonas koreensis]
MNSISGVPFVHIRSATDGATYRQESIVAIKKLLKKHLSPSRRRSSCPHFLQIEE